MPDPTAPNPREQDEQLARFTDEVRAGQSEPAMSAADELRELEMLVVRLNRAVGRTEPAAAAARRMRERLTVEWRRSGPDAAPEPAWQRMLRKSLGPRPRLALAALAVVVIVLALALPLVYSGDNTLPGAAGGGAAIVPVLVMLAVVGAVIAWWLNRRRR